jgi:nucleoside 2-deoxyribosyltransferase
VIKLYVGCGLTHASDEFKQKVAKLKERLKEIPSIEVLEFLGTEKGTSADVYVHDIVNCVDECDIMLAICDEPSTGLGWEMCEQTKRGKPLLAFGHINSTVTRLVLDPPLENYKFFRYQNFDEILDIAGAAIVAMRVGFPLEMFV